MSEMNRCPECGNELPASTPRGLCPACLLKRGLETNTAGYTGEKARWTPPGVEELAARFPELEITRLIGRGGMGAVYQARQKNLDRVVALKILPPEMANDPAFAERFAREAQAMARLNHPHIVTIHEFGQRAGWYYFIMEYVDGVSLRGLLDSGHVSPREALAIVPQICEALQYAHDQGIVHRDIKPENILLSKNGRVKIADFGLAKLMGQPPLPLGEGGRYSGRVRGPTDETTDPNPATIGDKKIMGTPQYMAPEQIERPAEVDHRADIYSLGVVFYQMLTGELPVGRFAPPSQKVQIDVRLDEVVLRALEKEPAKRYQLVSEVKTQVETIVASAPPPPSEASQAKTDPRILERATQDVRGPALGLRTAALINLFGLGLTAALLVLKMAGTNSLIAVFPLLIALVYVLLNVFIYCAARDMADLRHYDRAVMGSILAMIAFPGNLIGLPFGIWSLVVLSRRDIKDAFQSSASSKTPPLNSPPLSIRGPLLCFGLVYALFIGFLLYSRAMAPGRVASHFNGEGVANGWMSRETYSIFMAALPLMVAAVFWWIGKISRVMPAEYVRIPNRDYWLSPEHREEAAVILQRHMIGWACVMTVFFAGLHALTILANASSPPRLMMRPLLFLTIALLLALVIWIIHLLMSYGEPGEPGGRGAASRSKSHASPPLAAVSQPHFSRTAIVGAVFVPLFSVALLAAFMFLFLVQEVHGSEYPGPAWWQVALAVIIPGLLIVTPFGATILGWIAVSQIRRSAGKIYGMWLAVFDGLLFPLLLLDGLLTGLTLGGIILLLGIRSTHVKWAGVGLITLPIALLIIATADLLIVRRVWKAANKPLNGIGSTLPASPRTNRAVVAFLLTLFILGLAGMGLWVFHLWSTPGAPTPFNLRSQPIGVVIDEAGSKPDQPWAWQELESRLKDGKLTATDASAAIDRLIQTMRAKSPDGYGQPLNWNSEFIKNIVRAKLISSAQLLRLADAFYGPLPHLRPLHRLREGATRLQIDISMGNPWSHDFPIQQFNRFREVRVDGSPVKPEGNGGAASWDYWANVVLGPFAVGMHTVEIDFDSLLIERTEAVGIDDNTPVKDWPPGLRRWRRTAKATFTVYPADAVIVKLNTDPARNPAAEIAVDPIVVRPSGGGKKLVVTIKPVRVVDIPLSFDVEVKLGDQLVHAGSFWVFRIPTPEGGNQWSGGLLPVEIKTVADNITKADVVLKPSPGAIEFEPRVNEIWGKEIVIHGVELLRYDLGRAVESRPAAVQPASKPPDVDD